MFIGPNGRYNRHITTSEDAMHGDDEQSKEAPARKMSFFETLGAVFWSFIGLRRRSDYERDVTGLNPVYVIVAALVGVALFIALLLLAVSFALK